MPDGHTPSLLGPLMLGLFMLVGVGLQMWIRPLPALVLLLFFIGAAHCALTAFWASLVLWKPHEPSTWRRMSALAVASVLVVLMLARDRIANHAADLWDAANHVAQPDAPNPGWWRPAAGMAAVALAVYVLQSAVVCALLGWRGGPSLWPHCSDVDDAAELAELRRYFAARCDAQADRYRFGLELVRAWRVHSPRQRAAFDAYCAAHRAQGKASTRARLFHGTAAWVREGVAVVWPASRQLQPQYTLRARAGSTPTGCRAVGNVASVPLFPRGQRRERFLSFARSQARRWRAPTPSSPTASCCPSTRACSARASTLVRAAPQ